VVGVGWFDRSGGARRPALGQVAVAQAPWLDVMLRDGSDTTFDDDWDGRAAGDRWDDEWADDPWLRDAMSRARVLADQDVDVWRRSRNKPSDATPVRMSRPVDDVAPRPPEPLDGSFVPMTDRGRPNRVQAGARPLPDATSVSSATRQGEDSLTRLDPFAFDPTSILANRFSWFVSEVRAGRGSGFEALSFEIRHRDDASAQLIVPTMADGWSFESAVAELTGVLTTTDAPYDVAVGTDPDGCAVCVLQRGLDVMAVRLIGTTTNSHSVAVEMAERYLKAIEGDRF
jgi:hypothetical protein